MGKERFIRHYSEIIGIISGLFLLINILSFCFAEQDEDLVGYYRGGKHYVKPKDGFVPNETTAIKIAEAIWLPIYGEDIYNERPFVAMLKNNVWIAMGSLPEGRRGGIAIAEISKKDGKILRVSHGK